MLTPFDTGDVLQPVPWPEENVAGVETYGMVDFDDDESATRVTVRIQPEPDDKRILRIQIIPHGDLKAIAYELAGAPTIIQEVPES